jgi:O-antigen/teichoic acid export membrane protein
VAVLWISPWLFRYAYAGQYDEGFKVMPWTLTYCVWYGMLLVAQNYIWCAERMKLGTLPLAIGLMVNVAINLALIPAWGLLGAVVATTISTGLALAVLYWINHRAGMQLQAGMLLLSVAPIALCAGPWAATLTFGFLVAALPFSKMLVTEQERAAIADLTRSYWTKIVDVWSQLASKSEPTHAM